MIRKRQTLDRLRPYVPGKAQGFAVTAARLASNERAHGPSAHVQAAIVAAASTAHRYPDNDAMALCTALAKHYGVGTDQVIAGAGSSELLLTCVLATVDAGTEVVYPWPSFVLYPLLADLVGGKGISVPLSGWEQDLSAVAERVGPKTRVVFLCTPNNPTSTAIYPGELAAFLAGIPEDILVVLDEAYGEYVVGEGFAGGLDFLADHPNLLVLRTFSKAYGLAGLRVGYGIGHPATIAILQKTRLPFTPNAVAQSAALAALAAPDELRMHVNDVAYERERIRKEIEVETPVSQANFLWVPLPGRAESCVQACEAAGVLVRAMGPDALRVTVGEAEENNRFLTVMEGM